MKRKHIYVLLSLLILCFGLLVSCTQINSNTDDNDQVVETYVTLPDLTGMSKAEIEETLNELNIIHNFKFSFVICYNESDYDKFVEYGGGKQIGDSIKSDESVTVCITPLHLTVDNLDKVKLDVDYEGKSFIDDGIGEVILQYSVDGDTARFIDPYSKTVTESFIVRFLGIDTPESTMQIDPWGKAAAAFTKSKLENAKTIVLEAEGARTETYGRYLAFVWVDGELLNLELVQEAYSAAQLNSKSKYFQIMVDTYLAVKQTGRRFHGERDKTYKYN